MMHRRHYRHRPRDNPSRSQLLPPQQHADAATAITPDEDDDDDVYIEIDRSPPLISPLSHLLPSLCGDNTTSVISSSGSGSGSSSIYNSSISSYRLHASASAPQSSSSASRRGQYPVQQRLVSTLSYSNNNNNKTTIDNNGRSTMDISAGGTSALQYTNPKHFNAYYGVSMNNNNNTGGAASTSSTASASVTKNNVHNNALSTTSSSQTAQYQQLQQQQQRREELTQKLSQYTRQNDRRQALRALSDTTLFPRMHGPLSSVYGIEKDIAMAEREAAGERALLNGVKFLQVVKNQQQLGRSIGDGSMEHAPPLDSYFLQTLREVCGHMCEMDAVDADPMVLYGGLLLRLCRSASEQDALAVLTHHLCCGGGNSSTNGGGGELILLPLKRRHHETATTTANASSSVVLPALSMAVPLELDLYVESGNVHAKVTMRHELGLYKRSDLEAAGLQKELSPWNALLMLIQQQQQQHHSQKNTSSSSSSEMKQLSHIQYSIVSSSKFNKLRPWAYIDADVVERINFGSGCNVRMLHVCVPEDKNSGYVKK